MLVAAKSIVVHGCGGLTAPQFLSDHSALRPPVNSKRTHESPAWHVLGKTGERPETVARAVERGWLVTREVGLGRRKLVSASLTSEGRLVARSGR